jgi:hypothetical protein
MEMTDVDLGLADAEVFAIAFQPDSIRLWFSDSLTFLDVYGIWQLTWPDGTRCDYDARLFGRAPETPRLIDGLAGATVVSARATDDTSVLDVRFSTGLELHYEPTAEPVEEWRAANKAGQVFLSEPDNHLNGWGGRAPGSDSADGSNGPFDPSTRGPRKTD